MYSKDGKLMDRREMLRVKVKSLAVEARIIRKEELRTTGELREELYLHRIKDVRFAARHAHLAYGIIRGRTIEQMERTSKTPPSKGEIERLLKKYGPREAVVTTTKEPV
jgi:hypothetical protein